MFFGWALKANLPIYHQNVTCTLDTENSATIEISDSPSKFQIDQDVSVKVDPNTKVDGRKNKSNFAKPKLQG